MYVLECGDFADIISWTRSGMSFKVDRPSELEARVLPAIFKDAKFSSFRRKVSHLELYCSYFLSRLHYRKAKEGKLLFL